MCLIIDASKIGTFLNRFHKDTLLIDDWIRNKGGKLVYSTEEKYAKEMKGKAAEKLKLYWQKGVLRVIEKEEVEEKIKEIKGKKLRSNDEHIIALALVADAKLLFTGDKKLKEDFKRIITGGNVYPDESGQNVLGPDTCP